MKYNACVSHPDSDREAAESKADVLIVPPKQMSSALGSLLANYGSMSESDSNDEPEGKFASAHNQITIRIHLLYIWLDSIHKASLNCHLRISFLIFVK